MNPMCAWISCGVHSVIGVKSVVASLNCISSMYFMALLLALPGPPIGGFHVQVEAGAAISTPPPRFREENLAGRRDGPAQAHRQAGGRASR